MKPPPTIQTLCDPAKCGRVDALKRENLHLTALMVLTRDAIIAKCGKKKAAAVANLVEVGISKGLLGAIVEATIEDQKNQQPDNRVVLTDATGRAK